MSGFRFSDFLVCFFLKKFKLRLLLRESCDFPPWRFVFWVVFLGWGLEVFACCDFGMGGMRLSMLLHVEVIVGYGRGGFPGHARFAWVLVFHFGRQGSWG